MVRMPPSEEPQRTLQQGLSQAVQAARPLREASTTTTLVLEHSMVSLSMPSEYL